MTRKVTVSKFNRTFLSSESLLGYLLLGAVMVRNPVCLSLKKCLSKKLVYFSRVTIAVFERISVEHT